MSPTSADEQIAVDVLFGRVAGTPRPEAILAVIDSTRLYQGLYLLQQLIDLGRPMIVALTMIDAAEREGRKIDFGGLQEALGGVPVLPIVATSGRGFAALNEALARVLTCRRRARRRIGPSCAARRTRSSRSGARPVSIASRGSRAATHRCRAVPGALVPRAAADVAAARADLFGGDPPLAAEARRRYAWVRATLARVESPGSGVVTQAAKLIDWINRPWPSTVLFIALMAIVFQAVFAWATPVVDLIDAGVSGIGSMIAAVLPDGMLQSFVVDGAIAGVGSVIVFLPQILILFLFIILMEDTGYLARAAFLVDRAMRTVGCPVSP